MLLAAAGGRKGEVIYGVAVSDVDATASVAGWVVAESKLAVSNVDATAAVAYNVGDKF